MERELKGNDNLKRGKKRKIKKIIIVLLIIFILVLVACIFYILGDRSLKITKNKNEVINIVYNDKNYESLEIKCTYFGKDISKSNVKQVGNVDIQKLGKQIVTYECKTLFFKKSIDVEYNVIDEEAPILNVEGEDKVSIYVNDEYKQPVYEAIDNYDGDITDQVIITGEVNNTVDGIYEVVYSVKDSSGNETTSTKIVEVKKRPVSRDGNSYCGEAGTIYLTFDDGPNGYYTPTILDVLNKYNVKATFFVTMAGPDNLIKREFDEGHAIGLHSATHDYSLIYSSSEAFWNDMNIVSERIERITGLKTKLLRFPGGASNTVSKHYSQGIMSKLANEVEDKGYSFFDWNISSGDAGETTDPNVEYYNVINNLSKSRGNVILMHDIKYHTSQAIENIVKYGLDNGYKFDVLTKDVICHQRISN